MTLRITALSSTVGMLQYQFLPSYLINDTLVIDAGSIGFSNLDVQKGIRSVMLSHSHLDHIASLPIFLDNVYLPSPDCPAVYALQSVIDALKSHFFNDRVWPDIEVLSRERTPYVRFVALDGLQPVQTDGLTVTPVFLKHGVPTLGFVVDDGSSAVALVSDTAPTSTIWEVVQRNPRTKAVFLECAFPNRMGRLAKDAMHLTPALFRDELAKIARQLPAIAIHLKPAFHEEIVKELLELDLKSLHISQPNQTFVF